MDKKVDSHNYHEDAFYKKGVKLERREEIFS